MAEVSRRDGDPVGKVLWHVTMSLDGFITGPDDVMDWIFNIPGAAPSQAGAEVIRTTGALLAGRRSYDVGRREGQPPEARNAYGGAWTGPQFVLTHKAPDFEADPSIAFIRDDISDAVARTLAASGGKNVVVFGANVARQCLDAGLIDEMLIHLAPIMLGDGVRLFGSPGASPVKLERTSVAESGQITDLRFRVLK